MDWIVLRVIKCVVLYWIVLDVVVVVGTAFLGGPHILRKFTVEQKQAMRDTRACTLLRMFSFPR